MIPFRELIVTYRSKYKCAGEEHFYPDDSWPGIVPVSMLISSYCVRRTSGIIRAVVWTTWTLKAKCWLHREDRL